MNFSSRARSRRMTTLLLPLFLSAAAFYLPGGGAADDNPKANFIGAKKCKTCHNKKKEGAQYRTWSEAGHSHAYELLGSPEARATAKELGIDDPQKSGECMRCHSSVYFFRNEPVTNIHTKKDGTRRLTIEEGVSCESCHWAGSKYQKKKVMEDYDASIAAGMNPHPEKSCVRCHNEESPSWDLKRYTLPDSATTGFDFAQAWEKIKHPNPKLAKKKAKRLAAADKK